TEDEEINQLRERQMRNMLGTLLLSQGTPMILAGDEFGRTQQGNNNAYCQDNEIGWVDWEIRRKGRSLMRFTQKLTSLRHRYPILRRTRWLGTVYNEELDVKDVTWINPNGHEMETEAWDDPNTRCLGMLLDGRAQESGIRQRGQNATLLLVLNSYHDMVRFTLPECPGGTEWELMLDTNIPDDHRYAVFNTGETYDVTGRSLLLFALQPDQV
ncbi:MAG TPA: glycogen debranching enzyme GlgX, partial [Acetobacteraceae bacterium]|nr:glycogen debranching enzyme GlgX [Acetobacteraceae bacterium]